MKKDLHDIDNVFRSALDIYEATPSARAKDLLDAELEKTYAKTSKKRLIDWKKTAPLLLLVLTGFIIHETGFWKIYPDDRSKRKVNNEINNQSAHRKEEKRRNNNVPVNTNDKTRNDATSYNNGSPTNDAPGNSIVVQKTNEGGGKRINQAGVIKQEIPGAEPGPGKFTNGFWKSIDLVPTSRPNLYQLEEQNTITKVTDNVKNSIKELELVNHSVLKIGPPKKPYDNKRRPFKQFWMMTGFISYDQAGYKLDSDEPSTIRSLKYREAHEPSFSLGLLFTRQLTPRLGLQSGIAYSNTAIGMKPQKIYAFSDPTGDVAYKYITSSGYALLKPGFGPQPQVGDSLATAEAKHTIENITVPLAIKYTVLNKKISVTPGAGVEANFITLANLEVDIEDTANSEIVFVRKLNGTKSFYWSFVADLELRYNVNKKLSLIVRPVYKHAISPITKNNVVETLPYSFGLGAGAVIKF